jgi:hypothetical protein
MATSSAKKEGSGVPRTLCGNAGVAVSERKGQVGVREGVPPEEEVSDPGPGHVIITRGFPESGASAHFLPLRKSSVAVGRQRGAHPKLAPRRRLMATGDEEGILQRSKKRDKEIR